MLQDCREALAVSYLFSNMEKDNGPEHLEHTASEVSDGGSLFAESQLSNPSSSIQSPEHIEHVGDTLYDNSRNRKLNRRLDVRILPLCCWLYLLNFLDRGNIGNARVLNQETGDDCEPS